jgi:predicted acylesterase/phospholipase RssA
MVPELECDLVMKGGITSGIVYPGAIAQIGARYRLRSIGGTSAGAIAAAAAAAMEFGRASGRNAAALQHLAEIPDKLSARTGDGTPLLSRLFQPDPAAAPLVRPVLGLLRPGLAAKARAAAALTGVPLLLAGALAAALMYAAGLSGSSVAAAAAALLAWLLLTLGLLLPLLWLLKVRTPLDAIAGSGFGACSGMAAAPGLPSLTGWLHDQIQSLAGLPADQPLTFGDLWVADLRGQERGAALAAASADPARSRGAADTASRRIDLAFVASDMSRSISVQFPFLTGSSFLYLKLDDLEALLPAEVVRWMAGSAPAGDLDGVLLDGRAAAEQLIRLPAAQDLPVLFAARVSMSFPFLFRAVRFYLLRYGPGGAKALSEVWLADGGITSNFPVHLFDAPVPTRPTFCLNLLYPGDEVRGGLRAAGGEGADGGGEGSEVEAANGGPADPQAKNVRMARTNNAELLVLHQPPSGSAMARLAGWGGQIVYTARQWSDITLMNVPAYRDRIVHIRMLEGEGGLNLDMSDATIRDLDRRGQLAGRVIAERFLPDATSDPLYGEPLKLGWDNHRFVRFRSWLAALEAGAGAFEEGWDRDLAASPSVDAMIDRTGAQVPPPYVGYPFSTGEQRGLARAMVAALRDLHGLTVGKGVSVDRVGDRHTSPRPKALLRMRPPLDADPRRQG